MLSNKKLLDKNAQIKKMIAMPTIDLTAEEADVFLDYLIDQSVLKNNARIIRMNKSSKVIRAMGFGSGRFLKPGATFGSSDYKKTWAHNKLTLTTQKVRGCVPIYDDDLEDNIEGAAFKSHIMKLVAAKIANELDEAAWISDTHDLGGFADDDIRSLWDGWRYRIMNSQDGEDYYNDVSGAATILDATADFDLAGGIAVQDGSAPYNWEFKYAKALKRMPSVYKKIGLTNMRFWHSDSVTQDYVNALVSRSTALGDRAIQGGVPLVYGETPIVSCPLLPVDLDSSGVLGAGSYTDVLLTPGQNLIMGIQREITIEAQREAADEATYWFYSMRVTFEIENVNAVVAIENLTVA